MRLLCNQPSSLPQKSWVALEALLGSIIGHRETTGTLFQTLQKAEGKQDYYITKALTITLLHLRSLGYTVKYCLTNKQSGVLLISGLNYLSINSWSWWEKFLFRSQKVQETSSHCTTVTMTRRFEKKYIIILLLLK